MLSTQCSWKCLTGSRWDPTRMVFLYGLRGFCCVDWALWIFFIREVFQIRMCRIHITQPTSTKQRDAMSKAFNLRWYSRQSDLMHLAIAAVSHVQPSGGSALPVVSLSGVPAIGSPLAPTGTPLLIEPILAKHRSCIHGCVITCTNNATYTQALIYITCCHLYSYCKI